MKVMMYLIVSKINFNSTPWNIFYLLIYNVIFTQFSDKNQDRQRMKKNKNKSVFTKYNSVFDKKYKYKEDSSENHKKSKQPVKLTPYEKWALKNKKKFETMER